MILIHHSVGGRRLLVEGRVLVVSYEKNAHLAIILHFLPEYCLLFTVQNEKETSINQSINQTHTSIDPSHSFFYEWNEARLTTIVTAGLTEENKKEKNYTIPGRVTSTKNTFEKDLQAPLNIKI